jgi:AhpD family alkylhydroperoxidase
MKLLADDEMGAEARAVLDDIRATRNTDYVNNFWRALAHDPAALRRTWEEAKTVMAPGALDPLTKELVYLAVSVVHACEYCIRSHGAAARAKGMGDAHFAELMAVIALASKTNRYATAMQVPVDPVFKPGA